MRGGEIQMDKFMSVEVHALEKGYEIFTIRDAHPKVSKSICRIFFEEGEHQIYTPCGLNCHPFDLIAAIRFACNEIDKGRRTP